MAGEPDLMELLQRRPLARVGSQPTRSPGPEAEQAEEASCAAFGYLRGLDARALAIEFRWRTGDRIWFPYAWLGPWRFNPSVGLLLKFTGDVVSLVLIRGSNLDALLDDGAINLIDRGLARHRITYVREMSAEELRQAGPRQPTIDAFELGEFESQEEMREWICRRAPAFAPAARGGGLTG